MGSLKLITVIIIFGLILVNINSKNFNLRQNSHLRYLITEDIVIDENEDISVENNINLPIAIFHGVGGDCEEYTKLTKYLGKKTGVYSKCVEYGAKCKSEFLPNESQGQEACRLLNSDANFQKEFIIVAFSHGGLISRHIIEKCELKGVVKRLITVGSPHMGVQIIPCNLGKLQFLCDLGQAIGQYLVFIPGMTRIYAPFEYVRTPPTEHLYRKYNKFLAPLNNENPIPNEIYKLRFSSLEKLVLIKFKNDDIVYPKESAWFQKYDINFNVENFDSSEFYQKDLLGLKKLNDEGKVEFHEFKGIHMELTQEEIDKFIIPALIN